PISMEMSVAVPIPSHCGHMPPLTEKDLRSICLPSPLSMVTAPFPLRVATLKEYAFVDPRFGSARRAKRVRSFALMSETVPTVDRGLAPIRSWSTRMAVVSPSRTSTSGRAIAGMKPWTKAEYVSLIIRWDSAAMVSKTSELLPEPDTPVKTVRRRLGRSTDTFFRLFSRAPLTRMRSWLSAACTCLSSSAGCGSCSQPGRAGFGRADRRIGDGGGEHDRGVGLVDGADRQPPHPPGTDVQAQLEAEDFGVEGQGFLGIDMGQEARVDRDIHVSNRRLLRRVGLLDS